MTPRDATSYRRSRLRGGRSPVERCVPYFSHRSSQASISFRIAGV
jgi:hypothetical protein